MIISTMKTFLAILLLTVIFSGHGISQDQTIAEHPFFKPMIGGTWTESGEMALPQGAVSGKSTSEAKAVMDGQWIQQDGKAEFGSTTWEWRWMFRLAATQNGKQVVQARYIDTNGQVSDYLGEFVKEGKGLRLSRSLSETVKNVILVSNQDDGSRLVEVAIIDNTGKTTLQYKALGKKNP